MKTNIALFITALVLAVALGYVVMLFGDNRCIDPSKNPGWCGDLSNDVVLEVP